MPIVTAMLAMPLCRYARLAIPLYPRSSFPPDDQHSGGLGHVHFLLAWVCPVTHCQLACLLRLSGRIPPLPSRVPLLFLPILPRIYFTPGKMWIPPSFLSSPLHGVSQFPLYHYLEFLEFLASLQPVFCFSFFVGVFACNLHSRLWICSVPLFDPFSSLYISSPNSITPFTPTTLPPSRLLSRFTYHPHAPSWLDLIDLRERYTCHIMFTHIPCRETAGVQRWRETPPSSV